MRHLPTQTAHSHSRTSRRGNTVALVMTATAIVVVVVFFGVRYLFSGQDTSNSVEWQFTKVEHKPFLHTVIEQGEIESSSNVDVDCQVRSKTGSMQIIWVIDEGTLVSEPIKASVAGTIASISERNGDSCVLVINAEDGSERAHDIIFGSSTEVIVEVGDEVSEGTSLAADKLVELDSSALEDEQTRQQVTVNQSQSTVISADAALKQNEIARKEYLQGIFKQDEQVILAEILVGEESLSRAQDTVKFSVRLAAKGFLTEQQLKADQFAVQKAEVDLSLAQRRLTTLRDITQQKMLVGFDSDIESAKAKLDTDQKNQIEEESTLTDIGVQIDNCIIYAPATGQVVHANRQSSRSGSEFVVEAGASVRERQTIIRLPDPDLMQVKANINEGRIPFVRLGQEVSIKVGALEGQELSGVVEKVNKYAEPNSFFSTGVKEYAAFIRIVDPPPTIRTGMSAEVNIYVQSESSALQVPVQVLHEDSAELYCLVRNDELADGESIFIDTNGRSFQAAVRELSFSASNEKTLVISDGLREGDRVIVNPRLHEELLNRMVFEHRANWLLSKLNANPDTDALVSVDELAANQYGPLVESIADSLRQADRGENDQEGDGNLDINELAVFAEDGELYVSFKKDYSLAEQASAFIAKVGEGTSLSSGQFDTLKASLADDAAIKKMVAEFADSKLVNEAALAVLASSEFSELDTDSNGTVGWYEAKRFLQTAQLRRVKPKRSTADSGGAVAQGGGGQAGGGRTGGGTPNPEQIVGLVMSANDTDGNGELSKEEIDASRNPDQLRAGDADGDGKVTRAELLAALKKRFAAGAAGGGGGGQRPAGGGQE